MKTTVTFETDKYTEAQLRQMAAQYGARITKLEVHKPQRDLAGIKAKLDQLAASVAREFKGLSDTVAQGVANPEAVTDAHVKQFTGALDTGLAQLTTAIADIKAMTAAK